MDIVERLRAYGSKRLDATPCEEAAAEIERLRGANEALRKDRHASDCEYEAEIERLRAALKLIRSETSSEIQSRMAEAALEGGEHAE